MSRNKTLIVTARFFYLFAGTLFLISAFFLIGKRPLGIFEILLAVMGLSSMIIAISLFYDNLKVGSERETFRAVSLLIGSVLSSIASLIALTSRALHS